MRYAASNSLNGDVFFTGDDLPRLDAILSVDKNLKGIDIEIELDMPLQASVKGAAGSEQTVVLKSGAALKEVPRQTDQYPRGVLGVSCTPSADEVSVQSININFRQPRDSLTDRGVVWVFPGAPAKARLRLNPKAFRESNEVPSSIIEAAEKEVRTKILNLFLN